MGFRTVSKAVRAFVGMGFETSAFLQPTNRIVITTQISCIWLSFLNITVKPCLRSVEEFRAEQPENRPRKNGELGLANVQIVLTIPEEDAIMFKLSGRNISDEYEEALYNFVEDRWGHKILPNR